jgi:FkbM family methyltransferase
MNLIKFIPEYAKKPLRLIERFLIPDFLHQIIFLMRCIQGKDIYIKPNHNCNTIRLGHGDGKWCICPDSINDSSVIYSFGVGFNISFDLAIIKRFGAQVHGFDPTPLSKSWIQQQPTPKNFTFHPYGLANYDGVADFLLPPNHSVSYTMSLDVDGKREAKCDVFRFATILDKLCHDKIDIVKLDIEGAEYDVIPDLLEKRHRIRQLLIEFHHRMMKTEHSLERTRQAIKMIEEAGFSLFYVSPRGLEYCFLRKN